jgi:hypothetical protein
MSVLTLGNVCLVSKRVGSRHKRLKARRRMLKKLLLLRLEDSMRTVQSNVEGLAAKGMEAVKVIESKLNNSVQLALDALASAHAAGLGDELMFEFEEKTNPVSGERMFGSLNSANWWKGAEKRMKTHYRKLGVSETELKKYRLMPMLFYSDATKISDSSLHGSETPIRVLCGNLKRCVRNLIRYMRYAGAVPICVARRIAECTP